MRAEVGHATARPDPPQIGESQRKSGAFRREARNNGRVPVAQRRTDLLCMGLLFVAGATLCMRVFCSSRWGAQPQVEDEYVYLFQAKTLAAGHLSYPSPPLPEFFEAAHILVVPRFAAKYLPGHAAVLAPFLAAGIPWLAPCLLLGLTAASLFAAARIAGLSLWAASVAPLLLLANADVFPYYASYLSQSSSVAGVAVAIALAVAVIRNPTRLRIAALFAAIAFTGLVRPFAGVASAAMGAGVLFALRRRVPLRTLAFSLPPLIAGALAVGVVCKATTGSWTTVPWALYARQYTPYDGPGIGPLSSTPPERGMPAHLRMLDEGFRKSRARHTLAQLPAELGRRLLLLPRLLPGFIAGPFAVAGLFWAPLWPASVLAAAFFALQLTFHVRGVIYYLEMAPWLFLAVAAGAELAGRAALRLRRPLATAAVVALAITALWTSVGMAIELAPVVERAPERGWWYARWAATFEKLREQRAVVFIRYPPDWNGNYDLTYNEPDLEHAALVRAIDEGPRNDELLRYFPGRPAFVLDPITLRVERIR